MKMSASGLATARRRRLRSSAAGTALGALLLGAPATGAAQELPLDPEIFEDDGLDPEPSEDPSPAPLTAYPLPEGDPQPVLPTVGGQLHLRLGEVSGWSGNGAPGGTMAWFSTWQVCDRDTNRALRPELFAYAVGDDATLHHLQRQRRVVRGVALGGLALAGVSTVGFVIAATEGSGRESTWFRLGGVGLGGSVLVSVIGGNSQRLNSMHYTRVEAAELLAQPVTASTPASLAAARAQAPRSASRPMPGGNRCDR